MIAASHTLSSTAFSICLQVQYSSVSVITGFCQTLLAISSYLGHVSMAQMETVLQRVLLKLADGKGVLALEQQVRSNAGQEGKDRHCAGCTAAWVLGATIRVHMGETGANGVSCRRCGLAYPPHRRRRWKACWTWCASRTSCTTCSSTATAGWSAQTCSRRCGGGLSQLRVT